MFTALQIYNISLDVKVSKSRIINKYVMYCTSLNSLNAKSSFETDRVASKCGYHLRVPEKHQDLSCALWLLDLLSDHATWTRAGRSRSTERAHSCSSCSGLCGGSRAWGMASRDCHRSSQDPPLKRERGTEKKKFTLTWLALFDLGFIIKKQNKEKTSPSLLQKIWALNPESRFHEFRFIISSTLANMSNVRRRCRPN